MKRTLCLVIMSCWLLCPSVSFGEPSEVSVDWGYDTEAFLPDGYRLYRDDDPNPICETNNPNATHMDVNDGCMTEVDKAQIYFYMTAFKGVDESPRSSLYEYNTDFTPIDPPTQDHSAGAIEAESGVVDSPMQTTSDSQASGGAYIQTTTSQSGTASYVVNIAKSGVYKIIARTYASDNSSDSFYFQIDGGEEDIWDLNPSANQEEFNVWREDEVTRRGTGTFDSPQYDPYTIKLTQGTHTITFRGRETNTKLDYFYFLEILPVPTNIKLSWK